MPEMEKRGCGENIMLAISPKNGRSVLDYEPPYFEKK